MYERSLNEAELILSSSKEPLVPVRQVWNEVVRRSKIEGFEVASLADFTAMLEADKRFQLIPAKGKNTESAEGGELDAEMEQLGFYPEDRVRLRLAGIEEGEVTGEEEIGQKQELEVESAEEEVIIEKPEIKAKKLQKKERKKKPAGIKKTAKATRSIKKKAKSPAKRKSTVKAKKSKTRKRIKR